MSESGKAQDPPQVQESETQTSSVTFVDDGGRPRIDQYTSAQKFRPNDEVYLIANGTREGPFRISSVSSGQYVLCDATGRVYQSGRTFQENDLELVDYF